MKTAKRKGRIRAKALSPRSAEQAAASTLVVPIDSREFDLCALGLSRGLNFEPYYLRAAWRSRDRGSVGAVLVDPEGGMFGALTMRRQADHRFVITQKVTGLRDPDDAMSRAVAAMRPDEPPEPLKPIPFELDILSEEYAAMWPWGEAWSQELEVYHNPLAMHPIDFELLPGAVHWYEKDGEVLFSSIWPSHVLASVTHLRLEE